MISEYGADRRGKKKEKESKADSPGSQRESRRLKNSYAIRARRYNFSAEWLPHRRGASTLRVRARVCDFERMSGRGGGQKKGKTDARTMRIALVCTGEAAGLNIRVCRRVVWYDQTGSRGCINPVEIVRSLYKNRKSSRILRWYVTERVIYSDGFALDF